LRSPTHGGKLTQASTYFLGDGVVMFLADDEHSPRSETAERILDAFFDLAGKRGIDATSTRALAEAAGVNEVTIYRHFGDKPGLIRAAFHHASPRAALAARRPDIDTTTAESAARGLVSCLTFLRDLLRSRSALLQIGMAESWRYPELSDEFRAGPRAGLAYLRHALAQASPRLRSDVDPDATALTLLGLIVLGVIWQARGWSDLAPPVDDRLLHAVVRPLIDWN